MKVKYPLLKQVFEAGSAQWFDLYYVCFIEKLLTVAVLAVSPLKSVSSGNKCGFIVPYDFITYFCS